MGEVLLTKRVEFAAAHRYHRETWSPERNREVFGACSRESGHGHNYLLEVTVAGEVDQRTGMVVNLYDLKKVLEQVLEEFDHKHLNLDTPYFKDRIPTTENIALVLWRILAAHPAISRLEKVRLYEDEDLFAEVTENLTRAGSGEQPEARLTRRYHFSSAHRARVARFSEEDNRRLFGRCSQPNGHNYVLSVTVRGAVDAETGMVTSIPALDRLVRDEVVARFDHRDLDHDPDLVGRPSTGENLTAVVWDRLARAIPGRLLERVGLSQDRDLFFEYGGTSRPASGR
jgi:6-pyruvoyltetrahydropterin/6-carboxytetrahydropterin synthase